MLNIQVMELKKSEFWEFVTQTQGMGRIDSQGLTRRKSFFYFFAWAYKIIIYNFKNFYKFKIQISLQLDVR